MNSSDSSTPHPLAVICLGLVVLVGGAWFGRGYIGTPGQHSAPPAEPLTPQGKAQRRLSEADQKVQAAMTARLDTLSQLFNRGRNGARPFAEEALSWSGKWALLKGKIGRGTAHETFLAEAFAQHVFKGEDVTAAVEAAVKGFLIDLEDAESAMLVQLRLDLADGPQPSLPEHLRSDAAFQQEYQRFKKEVARTLNRDMTVTVGREVGVLVASDVAAQVAMRVARFMAAELGVEAGILGAGAASSVATLGVGLVAAVVVDYVLSAVLQMAGYDPAADIASKVVGTIDTVERALIDGSGGLRHELEAIHKARAALRKEIVNKLIEEGGK